MIKVIIGFLGMFGLIFNASGMSMWTNAPSIAIVCGVIVFGLLASGKNVLNGIVYVSTLLFEKKTDLASLKEAKNSLEEAGRLAMAGGIIGVLIGLVNMLMHMDDPAALGPAMSMCLLTALYGTFFKYVIFRPLACIAEDRAKQLDENI